MRHEIIAFRVVGWHAAFVAPEYLDQLPVDLAAVWFACQQTIQLFRRVATGQGDSEPPACHDGFASDTRHIHRRLLADGINIGINGDMHWLLPLSNIM